MTLWTFIDFLCRTSFSDVFRDRVLKELGTQLTHVLGIGDRHIFTRWQDFERNLFSPTRPLVSSSHLVFQGSGSPVRS